MKIKKTVLILSLTVILSVLGYMNYSNGNSYATPKTGQETIDKQGCCSSHDGVCGCQNGRTVCCDGTISPSCGCDE